MSKAASRSRYRFCLGTRDELLEHVDVDRARLDVEHVSGVIGDEGVLQADGRQCSADLRDVGLEAGLHGGGGSSPHTSSTNRSADTA